MLRILYIKISWALLKIIGKIIHSKTYNEIINEKFADHIFNIVNSYALYLIFLNKK